MSSGWVASSSPKLPSPLPDLDLRSVSSPGWGNMITIPGNLGASSPEPRPGHHWFPSPLSLCPALLGLAPPYRLQVKPAPLGADTALAPHRACFYPREATTKNPRLFRGSNTMDGEAPPTLMARSRHLLHAAPLRPSSSEHLFLTPENKHSGLLGSRQH